MPGIEPLGDAPGGKHDHLRREHPIDGPHEPGRVQVGSAVERHDLCFGVDPCVGPAGSGDSGRLAHQPPDGVLENPFHGADPGLTSPSVEIGPVVGDQQPEHPHRASQRLGSARAEPYSSSWSSSMSAIGAPSPLR